MRHVEAVILHLTFNKAAGVEMKGGDYNRKATPASSFWLYIYYSKIFKNFQIMRTKVF